jgi:TPR repeat protein
MALLERAAHSGHPQAQFQMGERAYGDGNEPENYVTAYVWYVQAQHSGADQADAKVTELESRMTPDQLSEARKRLETSSNSPK